MSARGPERGRETRAKKGTAARRGESSSCRFVAFARRRGRELCVPLGPCRAPNVPARYLFRKGDDLYRLRGVRAACRLVLQSIPARQFLLNRSLAVGLAHEAPFRLTGSPPPS